MAENISYRYAIVGIGAIGLGLAELLTKHDCSMLVRSSFGASAFNAHRNSQHLNSPPVAVKQLLLSSKQSGAPSQNMSNEQQICSQHGLSNTNETSQIKANIHKLLSLERSDWSQFDLLILPVKFYHLAPLISQLQPTLPPSLPILLLQNGLGGDELLRQAFPDNPLYIGSTTDAIASLEKGHIQINARGELIVGSMLEKAPCEAVSALIQAHPNALWDQDIMRYLYRKLAVNAVINPISAKYNCRNGEILRYGELIEGVKAEIFRLYKALKIDIATAELSDYIDSVITLTANNYSSMYQDRKANRPTEIDSILGVLLRKAAELNITLPLIQGLYDDIKNP